MQPTHGDDTFAASIDRLLTARTFDESVEALGLAFDSNGSLFVVDHDFAHARFVDGRASVDLRGVLAGSLQEATPAESEHGWWLPIPERDAVVIGMLFTDRPDEDARRRFVSMSLRLGLSTPSVRARFEDFDVLRRHQDMSIAAELQWSLLPTAAGTAGGYSFASVLQPAYDVAGDLFDYTWSDGALWAYSLDSMGHGVEATLSGVVALSAIRNARRDGADLVGQMSCANEAVHDQWHGHRFVTAMGCRLGPDRIDVVNAGHEPLRRRDGDSVVSVPIPPSLPLGVEHGESYLSHPFPALESDESLILLSDGSAEARDRQGMAFGSAAVDAALSCVWNDSPLRAAHTYLQRVLDFSDGQRTGDDITIVIVSLDPTSDTV